jgi:hypothetical protein
MLGVHPVSGPKALSKENVTLDGHLNAAATDKGLDKYCLLIAPYNELVERTYLCLQRDCLFVLFVHRDAVVKADEHVEFVAISPTFDENEVSNLEREARGRPGHSAAHAALC